MSDGGENWKQKENLEADYLTFIYAFTNKYLLSAYLVQSTAQGDLMEYINIKQAQLLPLHSSGGDKACTYLLFSGVV